MKIGLVVNPYAGLGGPAGLKGSDNLNTVEIATQRGVTSKIGERLRPLLGIIAANSEKVSVVTGSADLGLNWCESAGVSASSVPFQASKPGRGLDTQAVVKLLCAEGIDLLLFAGGDGTARDVVDALDEIKARQGLPVLGIPCGVKMHSGVFANNPTAAADIVKLMLEGQLLSITLAEVRDIDESAFQKGVVRAEFYGELWVPEALQYMQQVKSGGKEVEALVVQDIAAYIVDRMQPDITYFVGSGSTTAAIMDNLGLENTLLGVDVVKDSEVKITDAYESQLYELASQSPCRIIITVIGGQGHIFGRGNQQLSPRVIEAVGLENIQVVATKSKLESLPRGLVVDTGSQTLDARFVGYIRVLCGYDDTVLSPVHA